MRSNLGIWPNRQIVSMNLSSMNRTGLSVRHIHLRYFVSMILNIFNVLLRIGTQILILHLTIIRLILLVPGGGDCRQSRASIQARRRSGTGVACLKVYDAYRRGLFIPADVFGYVPRFMYSTQSFVEPNTAVTIAESSTFLRHNKFSGTWREIVLPSMHDARFKNELEAMMEELQTGSAYAAHFVSSGEGRFISLGSSFIITRGGDVNRIIEHLRDVLTYYEESYNEIMTGPVSLRIKYLGHAPELATKIIMKASGIKAVNKPWGEVGRVLDIPIPTANFHGLHRAMIILMNEQGHIDASNGTLGLKLQPYGLSQDWVATATRSNLSLINDLTGAYIRFNVASGEGVYVMARCD